MSCQCQGENRQIFQALKDKFGNAYAEAMEATILIMGVWGGPAAVIALPPMGDVPVDPTGKTNPGGTKNIPPKEGPNDPNEPTIPTTPTRCPDLSEFKALCDKVCTAKGQCCTAVVMDLSTCTAMTQCGECPDITTQPTQGL